MKAPTYLRKSTLDWVSQVREEYDLEEHHDRLLILAAEAWDRATQAREALAKHGLIYESRLGEPKSRPEIAVERDSRLAFARLLRELNLDFEPDVPRSRRGGGHR